MSVIHEIAMFENGDNRSTDPMPSFAAYADDVRLFTIDGELIVQVEKTKRHHEVWYISASDHLNCYPHRDERFMSAYEAIEYALALMNIPLSELEEVM
jgi:hypothetical protein